MRNSTGKQKEYGDITLEKREQIGSEKTSTVYCLVQDAEGYNETINFANLQELSDLHRRIGTFLQTQNC